MQCCNKKNWRSILDWGAREVLSKGTMLKVRPDGELRRVASRQRDRRWESLSFKSACCALEMERQLLWFRLKN